ncbi:hypothetical protein CRYUN_Cryun36dG0043700 [Craigia yunnanensis]
MVVDIPDAPETSVSDTPPEDVQLSSCCQVWKNKYSKAEKGRICLKQAVRLLEKGCDNIQAQNLTLKKAYEEEQARSKEEKEHREKELALRVSLENELSAQKSKIFNLKQKGVSEVEDKTEEIKLLKASVSDRRKEINWLKELVENEKKRADLEKKKAAEASKHAETEKGKAGEEHRLADIERKKAEDYRTQLEALRKEVNEAKSKLVSEKSKFDEETKQLQEEKKKAVEERKRADLEMAKAKEQRKIAEETKKKAVEERKHADLQMAEAEEQRKIAEETMKKAVEVRKCADFEMVEAEEQRKIAEETKKTVEDRKCAVMEMAKVEEQRKIAEATNKKAVEEKSHADSLTKQLEEARRRNEELEKKLHELSRSRNLGEGPFDQPDRNTSTAAPKTKERAQLEVLKEDADKSRAVSESLQFEEVEKENGSERKQADSEMRKARKKRKLVEVNTEKAMDGKHCGDRLPKQLEDARLKINKLQKQINELSSSRNLVDALVVSSEKGISAEVAEVKLLKKQLKFEKKRVKHAKDVARLEKSRSNLLQQEVGCMKLELIQFLNRLDALDKCFSTPAGGIDDMEKAGDFASMQWSKLKKKLCNLKLHQTCLQTENQLLKFRCMGTTVSNPLGETFQHAHLLPTQGGNCTESITGINSKLESLLGGSSRKMLRSSTINSSTASFSGRQLVGSQERGAFSVTTSAKLGEDNLNLQPTISSMSDQVTKIRCNENLAVVAENSVRSPLPVGPLGRVNGHFRKRKTILDAVESIELLFCESKKLHLQLEEKLSVLHCMVKGQMDKPREEAKLVRPNLQDIAYVVHDRSPKRRKISDEETVAMEQSCGGLQMKQIQSCPEHLCNPDTIVVGFEEVVNKNYMKLLDLDDAADEECYRMAAEMPVSPTLPVIEFPGIETFEVDQFRPIQDENCGRFSHENENVASSDSFDVIIVENGSNKLQCDRMDTLPKSLQHENECNLGSFDILRCNENGFCSTMPEERSCLNPSQNPGVEVEMSVVPSSGDEVVNTPFENEIRSTVESIPKYCVVFSNIKDGSSVSRIFCAIKTCIARCSLPAQTEFVMHKILHALKLEEKLLPKEKVCVFFSLVLLNFYTATLGKCSLIRDFIPCLNLFAEHINEVMSDAEPRSVVAELCLDELLSVIEDFLIEGRVMLYTNLSSETSVECDSRIHGIIDGSDIIFSHEAASADLLVAGSIILGSICAAADCAGFMCEAVYNIFRMHRYDTSVVLVILHVFAYVGGDAIFTLRNYSLTMTVLKSIVMFLESKHAPVATATLSSAGDAQPQFHAFTPLVKTSEFVLEIWGLNPGMGGVYGLGVDGVGYEDKEVENLRVKLSAFLWRETTIRAGLPIQLATVTALLGLISLDFEKVILENVKLPVMSGQFLAADLIRNWFSILTEEQRAMSIGLFQSVD